MVLANAPITPPLTEETQALLGVHHDVNRLLNSFVHSFGFSHGAPARSGSRPAWLDVEPQRGVKRIPTGKPDASARRKCQA